MTTVNVGGSVAAMRSSAEPFDLKPVSAIGFNTTVPRTRSERDEMTVTRPSSACS